jgi:hypothetical protein
MKIQNTLNAKRFVVCHGFVSAGEKVLVSNSLSGDFNQYIYVLGEGDSFVSPIDPNSTLPTITLNQGLTDLSDYYGVPVSYTPAEPGASWVCINPIPLTARYNVSEIVNGQTIQGDMTERTILCILNNIEVNDKKIKSMEYCRILNGVTATVVIPDDAIALLLERIPNFSAPELENISVHIPVTVI